jgi:hypothetical protein
LIEKEIMGNDASSLDVPDSTGTSTPGPPSSRFQQQPPKPGPNSTKAENISYFIHYAKTNCETNPTDSLMALFQALTLNGGKDAADAAMARLSVELGPELTGHVMDRQNRMERAMKLVEELLHDESTLLYQQGNAHILQQAMEDGSSVVCSLCNAMVPATRWQQHQEYWCEAIQTTEDIGHE